MWLVKPRNRCCGEGIRLINSTEIVRDLIDPELGEWYVQQLYLRLLSYMRQIGVNINSSFDCLHW